MDSAEIAFELMRFELEAEVESPNSDGAKHFSESQYDLADALTKKGKTLQVLFTVLEIVLPTRPQCRSKSRCHPQDRH